MAVCTVHVVPTAPITWRVLLYITADSCCQPVATLVHGVSSVGKDSYFNYLLRAGSYDCFLEELQEGSNVEIEYHVSGLCHCVW